MEPTDTPQPTIIHRIYCTVQQWLGLLPSNHSSEFEAPSSGACAETVNRAVGDTGINALQSNPVLQQSPKQNTPAPIPESLTVVESEALRLEPTETATAGCPAPVKISEEDWMNIACEMDIHDMTKESMSNSTTDISSMTADPIPESRTVVESEALRLEPTETATQSLIQHAPAQLKINEEDWVNFICKMDIHDMTKESMEYMSNSTTDISSMTSDPSSIVSDYNNADASISTYAYADVNMAVDTNSTTTCTKTSTTADTSLMADTSSKTTCTNKNSTAADTSLTAESSHNPTSANCTENAETKQEKERSKHRNAYKHALNHGAVKRVYTQVIIIGMPGAGKSTLLKTILKSDETIPASGHYSLVELNGLFTAMTTEQGTKSLAIMIHKVSTSKFGCQPLLRCFLTAKDAMKILFTPKSIRTLYIKPQEVVQFKCLKEIAERLVNDTCKMSEIITDEDILCAQLQVTEGSFQNLAEDILPILITVRSFFMLVFDASKFNLAVEKQICKWIADIHKMVCSAQSCEIFSIIDEKLSNGEKFQPKLILIGTHGDSLLETRKNELKCRIFDLIKSRFPKDILKMIIHLEISNLKGDCRQIVNVAQSCIKSLQIPVPLTWEAFRCAFVEVTIKKHRSFLQLKETHALAVACGINKTGSELQSLLHFCHEHGILLYYKDVECMNEIVIADPKWLIQQLEKLDVRKLSAINCSLFEKDQLSNYGILIESLWSKVWPFEKEFCNIASGMLCLMQYYHLAVALSTQNDVDHEGARHFVPCVLQQHESIPSDISALIGPNCCMQLSAAPLCFTFSTKYVPHGCFAMVAAGLMNNTSCLKPDFHAKIRSNVMPFIYKEGSDDMCNVVLFATSVCISIYIGRQHCCTNYKISNFASTCQNVFTTVYATLNDILRDSFKSIEAIPSFYCDCKTDSDPHFIIFNENTKYYGEKLMCKNREVTVSAEQQWWLRLGNCEFEKNGNLTMEEIDELCQQIPSDCQEILCHCLELKQQNTKSITPEAFIDALKLWAYKMGDEARSHFLYHIRRLKLDDVATKILLSSILSELECSTCDIRGKTITYI